MSPSLHRTMAGAVMYLDHGHGGLSRVRSGTEPFGQQPASRAVLPTALAATYLCVAIKTIFPGYLNGGAQPRAGGDRNRTGDSGFLVADTAQPACIWPGTHHRLCVIGLLILGDCLLRLYLTSDPSRVVIIALLLIGSAYVLNLEEFAVIALLSVTGWGVLSVLELVRDDTHFVVRDAAGDGDVCRMGASASPPGALIRLFRGERSSNPRWSSHRPEVSTMPAVMPNWRWPFREPKDGLFLVLGSQKADTFQFSSTWETLLGFDKGELTTIR